GLDLQGGIHWVLSPDLDVALAHELDVLGGGIRAVLEEQKKIEPKRIAVEDGRLVVEMASPAELAAVREAAKETRVLREVDAAEQTVRFVLTDEWTREVRERSIEQVLEVLRRRVDD